MKKRKFSGSDTFATTVVNTEEYLLLAEVMHENGSDVKTIQRDIEFIDDMLIARRVHLLSAPHVRTTKAGYLRKNTSFSDLISNRLNDLIQQSEPT